MDVHRPHALEPFGAVGSLSAFWPVVEPVLDLLGARRVCEVGVENGAFSRRLSAWCRAHDCRYVGIDPAPQLDTQAAQLDSAFAGDVIAGRSLDVLPGLDACDAYFIDGDHNYYTVRSELDLIERAALGGDRASVVFVHDVGWPWGRRDLYYCPADIPDAHRHPYSENLGVVPDRDELVDGGLRAPGRYAIACRSGGARNGVLTAVEDFLASSDDASGWSMLLLPVAYGLAVLYRPDGLPESCRRHFTALQDANRALEPLLRTLESNYVTLYLFGEDMKRYADGLQTYADGLRDHAAGLDRHIAAQERAYQELLSHTNDLQAEYEKLAAHVQRLQTT